MENKLKVFLYNAISLLVDETIENFDNSEEWLEWICNELGCSTKELEEFGINIETLNI